MVRPFDAARDALRGYAIIVDRPSSESNRRGDLTLPPAQHCLGNTPAMAGVYSAGAAGKLVVTSRLPPRRECCQPVVTYAQAAAF